MHKIGLIIVLAFVVVVELSVSANEAQSQLPPNLQIDISEPIYRGSDAFITFHFRDENKQPVAPLIFQFQVNDEKTKRLLLDAQSLSPTQADVRVFIPASANIIVTPVNEYVDEFHTITGAFIWPNHSPGVSSNATFSATFKATFPVRNIRFVPPLVSATPAASFTPTRTRTPTSTATLTPTP